MTEQEALRIFKVWVDRDEEIAKKCLIDLSENIEVYKVAIQALEKQIPKKPTRKGYRDGCPVCSVIFRENDFGIHYCWNCGTKLNWSDSNGD